MAEQEKPKIGAGHLAAMGRSGLKELTQILPAFPESVRPVEEPGLAGNPTNIEVVRGKDAEVENPVIAARGRAAEQARAQEREQGRDGPQVG